MVNRVRSCGTQPVLWYPSYPVLFLPVKSIPNHRAYPTRWPYPTLSYLWGLSRLVLLEEPVLPVGPILSAGLSFPVRKAYSIPSWS